MIRYEVLMLTIPEITEDEARGIETQLSTIVKAVKGSMISFERWGKYRLAFPVGKHEYGIYFLARFEVEKDAIQVLDDVKALLSVKLHEIVLRTMTARLKEKQALAYQRPPSLEEAPKREGYFDRDNRHEDDRPRGPRSSSVAPAREEVVVDELDEDEDDFVEAEG